MGSRRDAGAPGVVVIGAGPAGLTAGYLLARAGRDVVVLEASDQVGGLARTELRDGFRFDLGGHRFFTKSAEVERLWDELLGDELLRRARLSRIYWRGRFLDYPLRLGDVARKLGPVEVVRSTASYARAALGPRRPDLSFEDWVVNRFGRRLFELFFASYTEKVWGVPTTELRAEWAAQRIRGLSFSAAVRSALPGGGRGRGPQEIRSLIAEFLYPRYGPGQMWEAMSAGITAAGGTVLLGRPVERLELGDGGRRVVGVWAAGERIPCTAVISSLPLGRAVAAADPPPPPDVAAAARGLRHRDFLTVALILDGEDLFEDQWIYIHEPAVRVSRIQNFRAWSPWMVPDPGKACVGLEYFCFAGDDLWTADDAALVVLATRELDRLGLAGAGRVEAGHVIRVPLAYPIYDVDYAARVAVIRTWLDGIPNLQQIGRNGLHRYNNSDHSMLTAMRAVENLLGDRAEPHDIWAVNADSAYHESVEQHPYRWPPAPAAAAAAAPPPPPSCSIVIPASNRPATLVRCLAGVRAAVGPDVEVLVIDDVPRNSPARIRNVGAQRARGEIVVFVDADVIPHADAVGRFVAAFAADPELVAVFGSYDDAPPAGVVSSFRNLLHHHVHQQAAGPVRTFWAGLGAVRRDAFLAAGGFDERRFPRPMLEDVELGLRLSDAGHRILLLADAQGSHLKRWDLPGMLRSDLRDRAIPWTRLLLERREVPATLNLGWRHRASAATVLLTPLALVATRGRSTAAAAAAVGVGTLAALNHPFYRLLARRGGARLVLAGVPLHVLHHAAGLAGVPCGIAAHLRAGGAPPPLPPLASLTPVSAGFEAP